jgi:uncharacterized protein YjaZ
MKKFQVKNNDGRIIANIFYLLDYEMREYKSKQSFINLLIKFIPQIQNIGYAGFTTKNKLSRHLNRSIWGDAKFNTVPFPNFDHRNIQNLIIATLKKCRKNLNSAPLYLFIFPNFNKFKKEKMNGVGGFCSGENRIILDINPVKGWQNALIRTLCHEYHHSMIAIRRKPETWTLLESLIYEGMADNFAEGITKETSPWAKMLSPKNCLLIFKKIRTSLNRNDEKIYQQLFLGKTKKYPLWAGYSIGHQIVKSSLKAYPNLNWNKFSKENTKKILNKSIFGKS